MSPNPSHTVIPLASLFAMLRSEGFEIGTSTLLDIQKILASLRHGELTDYHDLKSILSPFICRNKEEQTHFNKVFDKYVRSLPAAVNVDVIIPQTVARKKKRSTFITAAAVLLILAAGAVLFWYLNRSSPSISLNVQAASPTGGCTVLINDSISFNVQFKDRNSKNLKPTIRIDDKMYDQSEVTRIFTTPGTYYAEAWVLGDERDTLARSSLQTILVKCEKPPSIVIRRQVSDQRGGRKSAISLK